MYSSSTRFQRRFGVASLGLERLGLSEIQRGQKGKNEKSKFQLYVMFFYRFSVRSISSVGRASDSSPEGQVFKSPIGQSFAPVEDGHCLNQVARCSLILLQL
jgi:hypothetical protein